MLHVVVSRCSVSSVPCATAAWYQLAGDVCSSPSRLADHVRVGQRN